MIRRTFTILILMSLSACVSTRESNLLRMINSPQVEYGAVLTEFGIFLTQKDVEWGKVGQSTIVAIDLKTGLKSKAPFGDSKFSDSSPFYDRFAQRICFVSTRDVAGSDNENVNGDIWCARREKEEWLPAERLPEPVNSSAREFSPVFDQYGKLYFASDRPGGMGQGDIYSAQFEPSKGWQVENLGPNINSQFGEWNVGISPEGTELIFEASSRPQNRTVPGDLYYSHRIEGEWSYATPLTRLNTDASDLMARWLPNGAIIYASAQKGGGDVDHYIAQPTAWRPIQETPLK